MRHFFNFDFATEAIKNRIDKILKINIPYKVEENN